MTHTVTMLDQYPAEISLDTHRLARATDATMDCVQTCTACAAACLSEAEVAATIRCIRSCLDCADACETTARILARHTEDGGDYRRKQLEACIQACQTCRDACAEHAEHMPHCATCERICRVCEQTCRELLAA